METNYAIKDIKKKFWLKPSVKTITGPDLSTYIKASAWSGGSGCDRSIMR